MNVGINYLFMCKNFIFCLGFVVSGLINKFGCRFVMFVGSILVCVGFLFVFFSNSVFVFMLIYGVFGGKICNLFYFFWNDKVDWYIC